MLVIFCADPFDPQLPDPAYMGEIVAARAAGFECSLIGFEALVDDDNPARAVRGVGMRPEPVLAVYRGWMLRPIQYERLYAALAVRNMLLINDPAAYTHAHYLPASYHIIQDHTPMFVWMRTGPDVAMDSMMSLLEPFGDGPVIVKDFVKSQKHHWATACYIPSASDRAAVEHVVRRFLELQGPDLNEGLVCRAFVDLDPLTVHSRSGMLLTREYHIFYLDGRPLSTTQYWDEGNYGEAAPPHGLFDGLARCREQVLHHGHRTAARRAVDHR